MIVDFNNSFISWSTPGGSFGRFNAEAYLHYKNTDWLMGTEVMACNVYDEGKLFKEPYYSFQPLFSKDECKVFRTYGLNGKTDDTTFKPSEQFQEHSLTIKEIDSYSETKIDSGTKNKNHYQCVINTQHYKLQFPIKHINTKMETEQFQVETGPIAFPYNNGICAAYVAFNKLNAFEVLLLNSENNKRNYNTVLENDCQIKIITTV